MINQLKPGAGYLLKRSDTRALIITLLVAFAGFSPTRLLGADVRLASPFVDHMVLQRGKPPELWGTADAGAIVEVHFADQREQATADAEGGWQVKLKPMPAGGPYDLTVADGANSVEIGDILVGDVWLCSGQSNMQYSLGECDDGAAVAAVSHPKLRLGNVGQAWTKTPQASAKITWTVAEPRSAAKFSAVAYLFAHELESDPAMKDVPIGILEDCLGGTVIESWLPQSGLTGFDPGQLQSSMFGIGPTLLYNAMIAPLGRSSFAGVIWYQGEGNAGEPQRYAKMLPILCQSWRAQFEDPALPIMVVQLPDYATDWGGVYWQWIRESQAKAVAETPNAWLAVSINTNDGWNLHPQGKHEIGRRLALLARQDVYKEKVVGHGPVFKSARALGSSMLITFDTDGDHLTAGSGPVDGFSLAGQDGEYYAADAAIDGESVVVTCADVPAPVTVRYAWSGVPRSTLTNSSGIPTAPFRTDQQAVSKGHGEAQRQPSGYLFKGNDYQIAISDDGAVTSLIVRSQQLLSNAADQWGGARMSMRTLSRLSLINSHRLVCSNNETSFTLDFEDDGMRWTLVNKHEKEDAVFDIALAGSVAVSTDAAGAQNIKRKIATVELTGIDRVTKYNDIAADDGQVLQATVPPGQTRKIELDVVSR